MSDLSIEIQRAEIEQTQNQKLPNSKYSQQIQYIATIEKEKQESAAIKQIRLSSNTLTILKFLREKEEQKSITNNTLVILKSLYKKEESRLASINQMYLLSSTLIILKSSRKKENLQNTRLSKRHRSAEADRQKFRRDFYKQVPVLKKKIDYQQIYTETQARESSDRRKFRQDLLD